MRALLLCFLPCLVACNGTVTHGDRVAPDSGIGADGGAADGATMHDGAATDLGGGADLGGGGDLGCTPVAPPPVPAWTPADTGGPAGESVTTCISRVSSSGLPTVDGRVRAGEGYDLTALRGGA